MTLSATQTATTAGHVVDVVDVVVVQTALIFRMQEAITEVVTTEISTTAEATTGAATGW